MRSQASGASAVARTPAASIVAVTRPRPAHLSQQLLERAEHLHLDHLLALPEAREQLRQHLRARTMFMYSCPFVYCATRVPL